jgi:hypothetical protein
MNVRERDWKRNDEGMKKRQAEDKSEINRWRQSVSTTYDSGSKNCTQLLLRDTMRMRLVTAFSLPRFPVPRKPLTQRAMQTK